jgi:hypothetical protein
MKLDVNNFKISFLIDMKFTAINNNKSAAAIIMEEAFLQNVAEKAYSLKQNGRKRCG